MLTQAQPNAPIWVVIDFEAVPCRFVSFDDSGGVRATYSDQKTWGHHVRLSGAESCFTESDYAAAKKLAGEWSK